MAFKGNPVLFYDVGVWGKMGYAVPNFGPYIKSANSTIRKFVEAIGRNLQAIMHHPDARVASPPSINTIINIHKLCMRARDLLDSEHVEENEFQDEPAHNDPAFEPFLVYPTPYFMVRNSWMKSYCECALGALSELMQSSENNNPMNIDVATAGTAGMYITRLYRMFCIELLKINQKDPAFPTKSPATGVVQPNWGAFTLTAEQIYAYAPSKWFTPTELIDTIPPQDDVPSAFDLLPISQGLPVPELPVLGPYPFPSPDSQADTAADPSTLKPAPAANTSAAVGQVPAGGSTSTMPAPPGGNV